jgi:hypothetical protein
MEAYAGDHAQVGADEVGSFPRDVSPFGVLDLGGNVAEYVAADLGPDSRARGGHWEDPGNHSRLALHRAELEGRSIDYGFRVCARAPAVP